LVVSVDGVEISVLVGHERIQIPILVHIEPRHPYSPARIAKTSGFGHIGKSQASPLIPEHAILLFSEGHEKIQISVTVVVEPRHLSRVSQEIQTQLRGDIHEYRTRILIPVKAVRMTLGKAEAHQEVQVPVPVEISPRRGPGFLGVVQSESRCHIRKDPVVIPVEAIRFPPEPDEEIKISVVVEVGPGQGLSTRGGEQVGLNELKGRGQVIRGGPRRPIAPLCPVSTASP